ncbi:MAG: hypothetical protein AAB935_01995, partial [Patescibacteria group bacterium]
MKPYFRSPRLNLSAAGEFLVKLVNYSAYIVLMAVALLFLLGDVPRLKWFGILFALFLADRLLHLNEAERSLAELKGEKINLALAITPSFYRVLSFAFRQSLLTGQNFYLVLLKELLKRNDAKEALKRLSVSYEEFSGKLTAQLNEPLVDKVSRDEVLAKIELLVIAAYENALETNEKFIEPRNLLTALALSKEGGVLKLLEFFNIDSLDLREALIFGRFKKYFAGARHIPTVLGGFANRPKFLRKRVMNRAWTARPTPTLDQFGEDLTNLARAEKIGFLIGHKQEFDKMLGVISRPGKPNALLVGEPGVGKSTLIAHLAFRMAKDQVPPVLFDKRLISLEIAGLVANAPPEVLAGRLQKIAEEII